MKRLLLVIPLMVAGCGNGTILDQGPVVTERLRAACPFMDDGDLMVGLTVFGILRDEGVPQSAVLGNSVEGCIGVDPTSAFLLDFCLTCNTVMANEVYR